MSDPKNATGLSTEDRRLLGQLAQRVLQMLSHDGNHWNISEKDQNQLRIFLQNFAVPRERDIAIGTLVKFAYVLETKLKSVEASERLLKMASSLLPPQ